MKLSVLTLSALLLTLQALAHASPFADKAAFEQAAKQEVLQGRANLKLQGLIVTEFDDSLNLCGELQEDLDAPWTRFIKIFDKQAQRFDAVWIEPAESAYEVEEFKKNQFESYWDRRCSSIR